MTNTSNAPQNGSGMSKIIAGILAAGITSYTMNWFSLHGVDFKTLGMDSEVVKASLIGTIAGTIVGFTPQNFVEAIKDGILFGRASLKKWEDALNGKDDLK